MGDDCSNGFAHGPHLPEMSSDVAFKGSGKSS